MNPSIKSLSRALRPLEESNAFLHYWYYLPEEIRKALLATGEWLEEDPEQEDDKKESLFEALDLDDYASYRDRYKKKVNDEGVLETGQFVGMPMSRPEYNRAKRIYSSLVKAYERDIAMCCRAMREKSKDGAHVRFPEPHPKMLELEAKLLL